MAFIREIWLFSVYLCVCARQRWITYCVCSQILWIPSVIVSYSSVVQHQPEAGLNNRRLLKLWAQRGDMCGLYVHHYFTSEKFIKVLLCSQ